MKILLFLCFSLLLCSCGGQSTQPLERNDVAGCYSYGGRELLLIGISASLYTSAGAGQVDYTLDPGQEMITFSKGFQYDEATKSMRVVRNRDTSYSIFKRRGEVYLPVFSGEIDQVRLKKSKCLKAR